MGKGLPRNPLLGSRVPSRPVWSSLGLCLVIPLVPRATLHRQELGPGCRRLGPRIPRAGALALKCARSGLRQFLLSFHSGYFCNPQSLTGPVSKASNPKSPSSAGPFLPSSAPAGPQPSLTPATRAERPRGSPRTPGPK